MDSRARHMVFCYARRKALMPSGSLFIFLGGLVRRKVFLSRPQEGSNALGMFVDNALQTWCLMLDMGNSSRATYTVRNLLLTFPPPFPHDNILPCNQLCLQTLLSDTRPNTGLSPSLNHLRPRTAISPRSPWTIPTSRTAGPSSAKLNANSPAPSFYMSARGATAAAPSTTPNLPR